ncbi:PadR family transcriptional regulator [Agromyces soli]|uniref:PadR family transcriptional regulator n=1 Tax=Agromyces soli TaxID=659012 RepID=A0ABY4AP81_9MICO|nr:helix-turn-helix transcriptional regulator [Agromyces soli]UOE24908.1 PadR family transcriptional regulator [Agromyces soli]
MTSLRITDATVDVLESLLGADEAIWGLALVKRSGRPAGTVYPLLERLERAGWLESEWEADTDRPGPRRRLYRLTGEGRAAAAQAIAHRIARRAATAGVRPASGVVRAGAVA